MYTKGQSLFTQTELFVHERENNIESQAILDANKQHYGKQVKIVYDHLMKGGRINSNNNRIWNGSGYTVILDVRARIRDIKDVVKAAITSANIPGGHGLKDWFMTEDDRALNKINHGEKLK